ncbi:hypothetical protein GGE07_005797 [Sinorhizobium terangae]|nr:hypothetical protein [Sinorhizobium terangae]
MDVKNVAVLPHIEPQSTGRDLMNGEFAIGSLEVNDRMFR